MSTTTEEQPIVRLNDEQLKGLHHFSKAYKTEMRLREQELQNKDQQQGKEQGANIQNTLPQQQQSQQPQPQQPQQQSFDQKSFDEGMRSSQQYFEQPKEAQKKLEPEPEYIVIPQKVILKPIVTNKFRLGLENTKEDFQRLPGTKYKWEPSLVGNTYLTGLELVSPKKREELERGVGRTLDFDFYVDLTYRMDGSNKEGHHMDLTKPINQIVYLAMLKSHLIAPTLNDKLKGVRPEAEWYIENLEAEAEVLAKEQTKFKKVFAALSEMSQQRMVAVCKIMGIAVRGVSPTVADAYLTKKLMDRGTGYEKVWDKFLNITGWSHEKIAVSEEVEDALALNIIRRNNAQDLIYADDVLGSNKEQVVNKLLQPENSSLRVAIKGKIYTR